MTSLHTEHLRKRSRRLPAIRKALGSALTVALALGASLATFPAMASATTTAPDAQPAAVVAEGTVADATLDWGVRGTFRNYIYNFAIFEGTAVLLGSTGQAEPKGSYQWSGGTGSAAGDGSAADVSYGAGNGVHFQSHPMDVAGERVFALDLSFTNPRVVVTSSTTGELRMDVEGSEFVGTTSVGPRYEMQDALVAELALGVPTRAGDVLTWAGAPATLTEEGSRAFGGFYPAGDLLDPVTFSLPVTALEVDPGGENPGGENPGGENPGGENPEGENPGGENPVPAVNTAIALDDSSTKTVAAGKEASFSASVTPADAIGSVHFFADKKALGDPITVVNGSAKVRTKALAVGNHTITAKFIAADPKKFTHSETPEHLIRVTPAAGGTSTVKNATLDWGVRESFRKYIYDFKAFDGKAELLGNVQQPVAKGSYLWSGGRGTAANDGTKANVSFGAGNGVHFQSHPMTVNGKSGYALDLQFTNPRIEINSESSGMLYMDVEGITFEGMTSMGKAFSLKNAPMARLSLPVPEVNPDSTVVSWKNVGAQLTAEGEKAFGEFYSAGDMLDPLNFSLPGEFNIVEKLPTSVKLSATPASTTVGKNVTLTASVDPKISGTVKFRYGNTPLGQPVQVVNGSAKLQTSKLPEGVYSAHALFEPTDSGKYAHANSNSVLLTIDTATKKQPTAPVKPTGGGPGAGSLSWGISSQFVGYTTAKSNTAACPTAGKHCAGGDITTSGVGAGYLFPQSGSTWNAETHTGSVNYSGTVSFNGYGMTMFQVANPTINVTGPNSATLSTGYSGTYGPSSVQLDLGSASKTVGANGEVTWSNVPVVGSLMGISASQSITFDSLSFTVGTASQVTYGSTTAGDSDKGTKYTPAATPPTTEGLTVVTDAKKLVPGARIEIQAAGFEPGDEGVLVVLYSDPIVLDETATADEFGIVKWKGKLPDDIALGEHVLTLQGSTDAGAKITILPKAEKKAKATAVEAESQPLAAAPGAGTPIAVARSGMALWEWWTIALSLVMIAGCTTILAVRQRAQ
ncbi:HtaA domain-containing protein [Leucobacter sp. BZR 635]